jgi:hypothetical protein
MEPAVTLDEDHWMRSCSGYRPSELPIRFDPFADEDGWPGLRADGDPWAKAVEEALDGIAVGVSGSGDVRYRIDYCIDGSIDAVEDRGGSMPVGVRRDVSAAIRATRLPKPSRRVVCRMMRSNCARIQHTFAWAPGHRNFTPNPS